MLISYKNSKKLKSDFVKEIEKHRKADQIIQGTYGEQNGKWKGCAVACSVRSLAILNKEALKTRYDDHRRYETDLGIPEWLARLEDIIFENLSLEKAKKWPTQFAKAIPVGVNLEPVKWKFCAFLMKENIERVLGLNINDELKKQIIDAIRGVLNVHETAIQTGKWDRSAAESAESAAWSVAESTRSARSVAESAARSAARSAAESTRSARSVAESAAWWAARSAARSAAESTRSARSVAESAYKRHSIYLLKLLKESK